MIEIAAIYLVVGAVFASWTALSQRHGITTKARFHVAIPTVAIVLLWLPLLLREIATQPWNPR